MTKNSPLAKAIAALQEQVRTGQAPMPKAVLVHPSALSASVREGPLTKAWRELEAKTQLVSQLEASLWARATLHSPVYTREELFRHVGVGHMTDEWYVKRTIGMEVHLLCRCETVLVLLRCMYGWAEPLEFEQWCEEPAFPAEGSQRREVRCGQHHGQ